MLAALNERQDIVDWLIENGANVSERDFFIILRKCDLSMVQSVLTKHEELLDCTDAVRNTPLVLAARAGKLSVVQMLVDEYNREVGQEAFFAAIRSGSVELVQWLLERDKSLVDAKDGEMRTALRVATGSGNVDVVKFLINNGNESKEDIEKDVLIGAVNAGSVEVLQWWFSYNRGAVNFFNNEFECRALLTNAANKGYWDVVNLLAKHGVKITGGAFIKAAESGSVELVQWLLELDKSLIDVKDQMGRNVLSAAAQKGNLEVVKLFVDMGVEINEDVFSAAISGKNLGVISLVLKKQQDLLDLVTKEGFEELLLDQIILQKDRDTLKFLVDEKGLVLDGNAFITAAMSEDSGIMEWLYSKNQKLIDFKDDEGCSALSKAAKNGRLENIKLLLKWAKMLNKDLNGDVQNALDLARKENHSDVVEFLENFNQE